MQIKILWIEGRRADSPAFLPALRRKGYEIELSSSGKAGLERLNAFEPQLVVINAASLRSNGSRICNTMRERLPKTPIILINSPDMLAEACKEASSVLVLPFTSRKLLNRIKALVPGRSNKMLKAGSISLDLETNILRCAGRKKQLTPRLVVLMKMLMENAGTVMERKDLFAVVWQTEYTGDTRTLDVHISWLRQALEENPRQPEYLKTVRGVGYRLDVEE